MVTLKDPKDFIHQCNVSGLAFTLIFLVGQPQTQSFYSSKHHVRSMNWWSFWDCVMQFLMGILKDFIHKWKVLACHDGSFDCGIQGFHPSMQRVTMSWWKFWLWDPRILSINATCYNVMMEVLIVGSKDFIHQCNLFLIWWWGLSDPRILSINATPATNVPCQVSPERTCSYSQKLGLQPAKCHPNSVVQQVLDWWVLPPGQRLAGWSLYRLRRAERSWSCSVHERPLGQDLCPWDLPWWDFMIGPTSDWLQPQDFYPSMQRVRFRVYLYILYFFGGTTSDPKFLSINATCFHFRKRFLMVRPKGFIHQCSVFQFEDEVLDG